MPPRHIGQLNRRAQLQQPAPTPNNQGGEVPGWSTVATVWAFVDPLTGRQFFEAKQIQSEISHRIVIRYRTDVTAAWRVRLRDHGVYRVFRIEACFSPEDAREWLDLLCVEEGTEAA
ncbi:MAG: phage head closure protein [Armatimonadota bacterium]